MRSDLEIGRVLAVDTAQVTIELSTDLKALARATYERAVEVGTINSYVMIPVGTKRIVAMVTRALLAEEAEVRVDKAMVALPSARRIMKATMIGTIDGDEFTQGISLFPVLDTPVLIASRDDLEAIFGCADTCSPDFDASRPGHCVPIGRSAAFTEFEVSINPDAFFGKHAAVIGSTGSGKSCSIATILQSILQQPNVKGTTFIILDTNGEYRDAFQIQAPPVEWHDAHANYKCLYIPTDPKRPSERLTIPYWFMDADDFVRLFRAAPGVQRPILLDALRLARSPAAPHGDLLEVRDDLSAELHRLLGWLQGEGRCSLEARAVADGCLEYVAEHEASASQMIDLDAFRDAITDVRNLAHTHVDVWANGTERSQVLPLGAKDAIRQRVRPLIDHLTDTTPGGPLPQVSADSPLFFSKEALRRDYLERVMRREAAGAARARENCATMLMRMHRLFEDRRFEFLFGPVNQQWACPAHALATFLRDTLGMRAGGPLSDEEELPPGTLPFYDRQRGGVAQPSNVVIVDLSLLAAEVLENVTALIGRLVLEFMQRLTDQATTGAARGEFPVVLVLEEAQNYIREPRGLDEDSISRQVFERIAREGRKYGLGLVIASQRPSEVSKTILSQCSSFIVHRLQNPEDLRYFREIVPSIYEDLLRQLSALAPRTALVLGECVRAPALVYMRECSPVPRSRDPLFYLRWVSDDPPMPDVEALCALWEGAPEVAAEEQILGEETTG